MCLAQVLLRKLDLRSNFFREDPLPHPGRDRASQRWGEAPRGSQRGPQGDPPRALPFFGRLLG